jgi:hypothetical protein
MSICSCKHNTVFHKGGSGPCVKCKCQKKVTPTMTNETIEEKLNRNAYRSRLPYFIAKDNPEGHRLYKEDSRRLNEEFKKDLFQTLDIVGHPKAEMLYDKAWDSGHSNGYSEVYYDALDLVDLIS